MEQAGGLGGSGVPLGTWGPDTGTGLGSLARLRLSQDGGEGRSREKGLLMGPPSPPPPTFNLHLLVVISPAAGN